MPIQLPGDTARSTPSAQNRGGLQYSGSYVSDTYSRSNIRAAQVTDNGMQDFGRAMQETGETLWRSEEAKRQKKAKLEAAKANSYFLRENLRIMNELEQDPDYEKHEEKYTNLSRKAFDNALGMIEDPETRDLIGLDLKDMGARSASTLKSKVFEKSRAARTALYESTLGETMENLLSAPDEETRLFALETAKQNIVAARDEGLIDDAGMLQDGTTFRQNYAMARAVNLPPAEGAKALRPTKTIKIEGDHSNVLAKMAWIESRGDASAKNPRSSATGLFQFTSGTAKEFGINPKDPAQSIEGARKLLIKNRNSLYKTFNRVPSGAELYLAHQQGLGGAKALLGNPDKNAIEVLKGVYSKDKSAENAILNNGGNKDMSAREFVQMWKQKYDDAPAIYDIKVYDEPEQWVKDIPYEERTKLFEEHETQRISDIKQTVYAAIDTDPAAALDGLNRGILGQGLEADTIRTLRTSARTAMKNAEENAETDRLAQAAVDNEDAWDAFTQNQMSLSRLDELEAANRLDPEVANFMRDSILKKQGEDKTRRGKMRTETQKADAFMGIYDQLDALQITTSKGQTSGKGTLEDYIRFQRSVMSAVKDGDLTDEQGNTLIKKVAAPFMDRIKNPKQGRSASFLPGIQNPYKDGFKAIERWLDTNGRSKDNMAKRDMLVALVNRADEYMPEGHEGEYSLMDEKNTAKREEAVNAIAQQVIKEFAMQENPALRYVQGTPNGIIKPDGSRKMVLPGQSDVKPDGAVQKGYQIMQDANGNYARVYADGSFDEITEQEAMNGI